LVVKEAQKGDFQFKLINKLRKIEFVDAVLALEMGTLKSRENFIIL